MMIDPASVAISLALLGAGWLAGRHARLRAASKLSAPVQPVCLCGHHYGTHDPQSGDCVVVRFDEFDDETDAPIQRIPMPCPCVRYTGPQPIEQYWVPPAADMSIITAPRAVEGDSR